MSKVSVGVAVLITGLSLPASAQQWGASAPGTAAISPRIEASADARRAQARAAADPIITEGHIARLRAALRLTSAQQPYWAPVEAALSDLARQQARGEAAGFIYRSTDRSSAVAATATHLRRLKAVAMPLIRTLDDNQKRDAMTVARHMGFEQLVVAAF